MFGSNDWPLASTLSSVEELVLDEALDVRAGEVFVHRGRSGARTARARVCGSGRGDASEARGEARGERRFAYTVRLTRDYNGEAARSKTLYE